ncbi:hypothetical protein BpHYR1_021919 [Brachionus plicatilis]|uniref:Uncharacterized protein n=1 Tax=Brachionus plicatilis TaxID=10195 RepID=A0A3M7PLH8_BRAPC|nr:hypothetical protein BpHYR1_021919 [Brachionus plicatilis]
MKYLTKLNGLFKINFVITTLCNFQSCISYRGLQNSTNFIEIRFQCVQAQFRVHETHLSIFFSLILGVD